MATSILNQVVNIFVVTGAAFVRMAIRLQNKESFLMPRLTRLLAVVVLVLAAHVATFATAQEAEPIGFAAVAKGEVFVVDINTGEKTKLAPQQKVFANQKVITGRRARVQLILNDDSVYTVGRNSEIDLKKFSFNPETQAGASQVETKRGIVKFVTGKIAKKTPESVKVKTPFATIGVRGSGGIVSVAPGGQTMVGLTQCCLDVGANEAGAPPVPLDNVNTFSEVNDPSAPPTPPEPMTPDMIASLNADLSGGFSGEEGGEDSTATETPGDEGGDTEDDTAGDSGTQEQGDEEQSGASGPQDESGDGEPAAEEGGLAANGEGEDGGGSGPRGGGEDGGPQGNDGEQEGGPGRDPSDGPGGEEGGPQGPAAEEGDSPGGPGAGPAPDGGEDTQGGTEREGGVFGAMLNREGDEGGDEGPGPERGGRGPRSANEGPRGGFDSDGREGRRGGPDRSFSRGPEGEGPDNRGPRTAFGPGPDDRGTEGGFGPGPNGESFGPGGPEGGFGGPDDGGPGGDFGPGPEGGDFNTVGGFGPGPDGGFEGGFEGEFGPEGGFEGTQSDFGPVVEFEGGDDFGGDYGGDYGNYEYEFDTTYFEFANEVDQVVQQVVNEQINNDETQSEFQAFADDPNAVTTHRGIFRVRRPGTEFGSDLKGTVAGKLLSSGAFAAKYTETGSNQEFAGLLPRINQAGLFTFEQFDFFGDNVDGSGYGSPLGSMLYYDLFEPLASEQVTIIVGERLPKASLPTTGRSFYAFLPDPLSDGFGLFDFNQVQDFQPQDGADANLAREAEIGLGIDWGRNGFFGGDIRFSNDGNGGYEYDYTIAFGRVLRSGDKTLDGKVFDFRSTNLNGSDEIDIAAGDVEAFTVFGRDSTVDGTVLEASLHEGSSNFSGVDAANDFTFNPIVRLENAGADVDALFAQQRAGTRFGYMAGFMQRGNNTQLFMNADSANEEVRIIKSINGGEAGARFELENSAGDTFVVARLGKSSSGDRDSIFAADKLYAAEQGDMFMSSVKSEVTSHDSNASVQSVDGAIASEILISTPNDSSNKCEACEYTDWGIWAAKFEETGAGVQVDGQLGTVHLMPYVVGERTATSVIDSMTSSLITATYNGMIFGAIENAGDVRYHHGNFTGSVNFGTRDVAIDGNFAQYNFDGNASFNSGENEFSGSITGTGITSGQVEGGFFGPNAEEMAGQFNFQGGNGDTAAGIYQGKR